MAEIPADVTPETLACPEHTHSDASTGGPDEAQSAPARAPLRARFGDLAVLAGVLVIGLAVRAWLVSDAGLSHASDMRLFASWTRGLAEHGLAGFYEHQGFCDYPPLSILIFYMIGWLARFIPGALANDAVVQALVKTPACLADLLIGVLICVEARRWLGRRAGAAAAALYVLNPVVVYNSAYWGQVDSIYTLFVLLALICLGRQRWTCGGAALAAGLLAKFQAIAFAPLLLFEAYRLGSWRGARNKVLGAFALATCILAPFALTDTLNDVLRRSYVNVIGQYHDLSKGAFNVWHLLGSPDSADTGIPAAIGRVAAQGRAELPADSSWLLHLNWRRLSLVAYALSVAIVLSLYSLRPGPVARYGAAAWLGLAFFLFPTEMHERYAFPTLAFLAVWALSGAWKERLYYLLSALLLLNVAAILPARPVAAQIGAALLLLFGFGLAALIWPRTAARETADTSDAAVSTEPSKTPALIAWFRRLTVAGVLAVAATAGWIAQRAIHTPPTPDVDGTIYLSALTPRVAQQGWGTLGRDRSVAGGTLQLGEVIYLRGLGTHAPSRIVYDIPTGCTEFGAIVGIDATTSGAGSVVVSIELDGNAVFTSPPLTGRSTPLPISIPLGGARQLTLRADPTGDGQRADHVNWALARLESVPGALASVLPNEPGAPAEAAGKAARSPEAPAITEADLARLRRLRPGD